MDSSPQMAGFFLKEIAEALFPIKRIALDEMKAPEDQGEKSKTQVGKLAVVRSVNAVFLEASLGRD